MSVLRAVTFVFLGVCGICVSLYAIHVEEMAKVPGYVASCDFGKFASCSRVLSSEYSHFLRWAGAVPRNHPLDVSNAVLGVMFYVLIVLFPLIPGRGKRLGYLLMCTLSLAFSVFLAYILYFILVDFCAVCVSTYVLNTLIFLAVLREYRSPPTAPKAKKKAT
ncbi:unnamed protein product [Vitrella brassicaformis CCMP3155]|uniref:vitamin-K-epoxide reductase (warfarin-sensitive) n=2 Tax=Vitrella brassicaformis TaxID=1169539 RepID=A0A0G4EE18_VITBC|nr:unnamed protein product [Vitrella brassicaformis CCMP3155]|eukprot:CEL93808.1 unnamed protein product [Vitrella brassicaformis CCMP3155]